MCENEFLLDDFREAVIEEFQNFEVLEYAIFNENNIGILFIYFKYKVLRDKPFYSTGKKYHKLKCKRDKV